MKHQIYFPSTLSAQVLWLMQFRKEFPLAAAQLNVQQSDIDSILIDIEWLVYGLRGLRSPLVHLTKAVTAYNKLLQSGEGHLPMEPPSLIFPSAPNSPPPPPGALRRVFNMAMTLKKRPGYDKSMGLTLGIESNLYPQAEAPAPTFKLRRLVGATHAIVEGRFRRFGHPGVWVESQRGDGDWEPVEGGIYCEATFRDDRPMLHPDQPEYRQYRMRFWDAKPIGEWTPAASIMVGTALS